MQKKKLGEVSPFPFEDFLLISLDNKWSKIFGEIPKFEVLIDGKGKLNLKSTKSIQYK